jgi:hypothetical protein
MTSCIIPAVDLVPARIYEYSKGIVTPCDLFHSPEIRTGPERRAGSQGKQQLGSKISYLFVKLLSRSSKPKTMFGD